MRLQENPDDGRDAACSNRFWRGQPQAACAAIPGDIRNRAKLLYLNYPHNPTGAMPPDEFYPQAIEFAKQNKLII